jgi:antitoxin (DNA-binding transcriptional repressor) of toxin-antitoxin stability system
MAAKFIDIHAAKTGPSQVVERAERGERMIIARDGKPVAELGPAPKAKREALSPNDPLLNVGDFAIDGAGGPLTNIDIDRILYGKP